MRSQKLEFLSPNTAALPFFRVYVDVRMQLMKQTGRFTSIHLTFVNSSQYLMQFSFMRSEWLLNYWEVRKFPEFHDT
jgi:hypothetical protein